MNIIETISLKKQFKHFAHFKINIVNAVDNLNLTIRKGEIFAFLGPNGAGKTTTINMLIGFLKPTFGEINLFGKLCKSRDSHFKKRVGYLSESPELPNYYRVYELLEFFYNIFHIPQIEQKERSDKILSDVGILPQKKQWIKNLSMGQKRCLGLAISLINNPELLLLDEPTVYLDPLILEKIRNLLLELKKRGTTIFLSSHILSEVEKISDRFAIIKQGKLIEQGNTNEIKQHTSLEDEFLKKIKEDE